MSAASTVKQTGFHYLIIAHLLHNFNHFFIALRTFRIEIGQPDTAAQCICHIKERSLGIIALHSLFCGMVVLTAGNLIAVLGFRDGDAELPQTRQRQVHVRAGLQTGQQTDAGCAFQQRQGKQQSRDVLRGDIALQLKRTGAELSPAGRRA